MRLDAAIYVVGATGIFPSRAFMPAFFTALILRYGHLIEIPFVGKLAWLQVVKDVPTWFTHDVTLWVLGILSVVEFWATKDPDIRSLLDEFDKPVKSIVSLLISFGVLSTVDGAVLQNTMGMTVAEGSLAVGCSVCVYFLAVFRQTIYDLLSELDHDNSFGIQRLFAWIEDSWVIGALILLLVLPVVMLILSALVFFSLYLVRQYLERKEQATKVDCMACGSRIFASAMICHNCKRQVDRPCVVGFFGQSRPEVPAYIVEHPFRLLEHCRCPACASRLSPDRACSACGLHVFDERKLIEDYIKFIDRRRQEVLLVCLVLSVLPVVAVVPAIVYYRLSLVVPYQRHIARTRRSLTRWLNRLAILGILVFQPIPIIGAFTLPLMAMTSHHICRASGVRQVLRDKI